MNLKSQFKLYQSSGGSLRKLASILGIKNHTYVALAINGWGEYNLSDEKKAEIEEKIEAFFSSKQLKISGKYDEICQKAGIIPFNNTITIIASVIKAVKQKALMKITAKSGTGKTTALYAVGKALPQSVRITAYDGMSKKELLEEISDAIGANPKLKSQQHLIKAIKDLLEKTPKVIIIDEANFLNQRSLEQLRHIQDETMAPIILAGTEELDLQIARSHEQVATRVRKPASRLESFGENEVIMLFERANIDINEKEALLVWNRCSNLREVKYALDDLIELYEGDIKRLKDVLP